MEEQNVPKKFTSFEQFVAEYYPEHAQTMDRSTNESERSNFGETLALESMARHSHLLKRLT